MSFSVFEKLCHHHYNQIWNIFTRPPQKSHMLIGSLYPFTHGSCSCCRRPDTSVVSGPVQPCGCSLTGSSVHGILQQEEYWSRLPCSPPGDLPNPEIKPRSSALQADSLPLSPQESPTTLVLDEQSSTCYINLFPTLHLNGTM